jgi:hypothetical protein
MIDRRAFLKAGISALPLASVLEIPAFSQAAEKPWQ